MTPGSRIGLFLRANNNEFQDLLREECRAAARRHNLLVREVNANNDEATQLRQIEASLEEPASVRPRAFLVSPVREAALRLAAHDAAVAGVGWVSLNRSCDYLAPLRQEFPHVALFSVHPDQEAIGRIHARQVRLLLPNGGDVVYVQGPVGTASAQQRAEAFRRELGDSAYRIESFAGDWSEQAGVRALASWLLPFRQQRSLPDFVVCAQNDSMAMGARKALLEAADATGRPQLKNVRILGCDGSPGYGMRWVVEKKLAATICNVSPGRRAVDEIAVALEMERPPRTDISLSVSSFPELEVLAKAGSA
jgi:ABC-type sugar transport system substrate-binding protein